MSTATPGHSKPQDALQQIKSDSLLTFFKKRKKIYIFGIYFYNTQTKTMGRLWAKFLKDHMFIITLVQGLPLK